MIRFLHLSDVHLNVGFANKSSIIRKQIKEALYESIEKAMDFTIENALEGLIIAGDFFDDEKIPFRDEYFILAQLKRILDHGIKIFYVTGNHDPMLTARFLEPLRHHALFYGFDDDTIKCIDVKSRSNLTYKVVGVGHKSKNEQRNLIEMFPCKSNDDIWLGIGHASVPSAIEVADKARYMAAPLAQIEKLNYNYFALGHIHIRQLLTPKIGYSGSLQGLSIKETGPKGGFLVTLTQNVTQVEPVNFNVIHWAQYDLKLQTSIQTLSELQQLIVEHVSSYIETHASAAKQMIMRMNLVGKSALKAQLELGSNLTFLTEVVKDKTGLLDFEIKSHNVYNNFDLDALASENTILSQMIRRISDDTYEPELLKKIFNLPIFDGKQTALEKEAYLLAMKTNLLHEVIDRMVVKTDDH